MIYYSHRTRRALAEERDHLPLGVAHYSYGTVCQKFLKAFRDHNIEAQELLMPESYASPRDIRPSPDSPHHILFKPFDEIRLLKGAINIGHVAWEFDRLPTHRQLPQEHPRRGNIFNDYVHALGILSEIWVGCSYTKRVFAAHGLTNTHIVPAPIANITGARPARRDRWPALAPRIPSIELSRTRITDHIDGRNGLGAGTMLRAIECSRTGGRVFLSVFNPHDPRKNPGAMILGFQDFIKRTHRNDLLIIKLVLDGESSALTSVLTRILPGKFTCNAIPFNYVDCGNILLIPDTLPTAALEALYDAADFYLCTSGAEGQGLPVLEAMATGLVPIAPAETAMADYIRPDNAVVLKTERAPIPLQAAQTYALSDLDWSIPDYRAVSRGVAEAVSMTTSEYEQCSRAAVETVQRHYSQTAVIARIRDRLNAKEK